MNLPVAKKKKEDPDDHPPRNQKLSNSQDHDPKAPNEELGLGTLGPWDEKQRLRSGSRPQKILPVNAMQQVEFLGHQIQMLQEETLAHTYCERVLAVK